MRVFVLTFVLAAVGTAGWAQPPSGQPYRSEEVTFSNGPVTLAGTLTVPDGRGPFRAVIMLTGSGAQNRDEELFGFRIFGEIADHLSRHGIAVLRYDDRGVGGSTGRLATSTMADSTGDALAGVALLAGRPEIDRTRIGVFGHSEGAEIAARAATQSADVAFLVLMGPPAVPGEVILARQQADGARALGATPEQIAVEQAAFHAVVAALRSNAGSDALRAALRDMVAAQFDARSDAARALLGDRDAFVASVIPAAMAQLGAPAMRNIIDSDPGPVLAAVACPTLALFGGKDTQGAEAASRRRESTRTPTICSSRPTPDKSPSTQRCPRRSSRACWTTSRSGCWR